MIICLDTCVLVYAMDHHASESDNPERRQRHQDAKALIGICFNPQNDAEREHEWILPAPALAEFMAARYGTEKRKELAELFEQMDLVEPFDTRAAMLAGAAARLLVQQGHWPGGNTAKDFMKVDCQIACVGIERQADIICSNNQKDFGHILCALGPESLNATSARLMPVHELLAEIRPQNPLFP